MDIKTSLATQGYAQARSAANPLAGNSNADRDGGLGKIATSFLETMQQSEDTAKAAMLGNADPHTLVQALAPHLTGASSEVVSAKVLEVLGPVLAGIPEASGQAARDAIVKP